MEYPDDLYYSHEHLWVRLTGSRGILGITDHAQQEMGEILFVELPEEGAQMEKDDSFGTLESSKTIVELICPLSGEIAAINKDLEDEPSLVNDDPYGNGWLAAVEIDDPKELDKLIRAADYEEYLDKLEKKE
jgi:glycine cleavage system H protein